MTQCPFIEDVNFSISCDNQNYCVVTGLSDCSIVRVVRHRWQSMYRNMQCLTQYPALHTHFENYNFCVVIVVIIIIRDQLGLDRPVSASSNSLFKDLPCLFVHLVYTALWGLELTVHIWQCGAQMAVLCLLLDVLSWTS